MALSGEPPSAETRDGTIRRVVRVLTAMVDQGQPMAIIELAALVKLPTSTVHRLVNLLRSEGLVDFDARSRRYTVGAELYRISARVLSQVQITSLAQPILSEAASKLGETVLLGWHLGSQHALMFVARADGPQVLQYRIELNSPLALVWGASGKAILAFLPDPEIEAAIGAAHPSPASGSAVPERKSLLGELEQIRSRGFAVSNNERLQGAHGTAVPVFGAGVVVGSICLTRPKERVAADDVDAIVQCLAQSARELSRLLGNTVVPT